MTEPELANATYWSSFWSQVEHWAFLVVVVALAIEFAAIKFAEPYKAKVDSAREFQIAELRTEAESSRAGIAEANARTAEAQLKLESLREKLRPRSINPTSFAKALESKPSAPVHIVYPRDDTEAFALAMQLSSLLSIAKWPVSGVQPVGRIMEGVLANVPSVMVAGGQPTGVSIVANMDSDGDFLKLGDPKADTPLNALTAALLGAFGQIGQSITRGEEVPPQVRCAS